MTFCGGVPATSDGLIVWATCNFIVLAIVALVAMCLVVLVAITTFVLAWMRHRKI